MRTGKADVFPIGGVRHMRRASLDDDHGKVNAKRGRRQSCVRVVRAALDETVEGGEPCLQLGGEGALPGETPPDLAELDADGGGAVGGGRGGRGQVVDADPAQGLAVALDAAGRDHDLEGVVDAAAGVALDGGGVARGVEAAQVGRGGQGDLVGDLGRRALVVGRELGRERDGRPAQVLAQREGRRGLGDGRGGRRGRDAAAEGAGAHSAEFASGGGGGAGGGGSVADCGKFGRY